METRDIEGAWSLSCLYDGFDDPAFEADCARFGELMDNYAARVREFEQTGFNAAALAELIEREEAMWVIGKNLHEFTHLRQSIDAGDVAAVSTMARLKKLHARMALPVSIVRRQTAALELTEADYAESPTLGDYRFIITQMKDEGAHALEPAEEALFARMQGCAGSAWINQRNLLVSYATAPLNGRDMTITELFNLQRTSASPTERKAAFAAELTASRSIAPSMAFSLNGIKEQVSIEANLRGYDSALDLTMTQSRMSASTLDALWDAVRAHLPLFQAYLHRKAKLLGHENGLPWYDLFAGIGECNLTFTVDEARDYLVEHLGGFAPDLGELVQRAFAEEWIDLYPRPGKSGGAFCRNLSNQRQSRVLTNFDGSLKAVTTIAHELGHAYHGQQIETHRPLNRIYTMPVAETASNFDEALVMKAAIAASEGSERLALLEQRLQDCTQTICGIYSRYLFEKEVFERVGDGVLLADDLCDIMSRAQVEAFGDSLDPAYLHPYAWVGKVHYYMTTLSYYNFPYAFGLLLAEGMYARYLEEGSTFVEKYRAMLRHTTVSTVEEAAAVAGEDVTSVEFWNRGLDAIAEQIEEFLALTE